MVYYFVLALLLLTLLYFGRMYLIFRRFPYYRGVPLGDVITLYRRLLEKGKNGYYVVVKLERKEDLALQFFKYTEMEQSGLLLDYPLAAWSRPYYQSVLLHMGQMNLHYVKRQLEDHDSGPEADHIINVDFGVDIERTYEFTRRIFLEVYKARSDEKYTVYFGHVDRETKIRP